MRTTFWFLFGLLASWGWFGTYLLFKDHDRITAKKTGRSIDKMEQDWQQGKTNK